MSTSWATVTAGGVLIGIVEVTGAGIVILGGAIRVLTTGGAAAAASRKCCSSNSSQRTPPGEVSPGEMAPGYLSLRLLLSLRLIVAR